MPTPEIQHAGLVGDLCKPGADVLADLTPATAHLLHMAVGLSGEVGELLEAVMDDMAARLNGVGRVADAALARSAKLRTNLVEELGDYEFYAEGLRQGLGVQRETVLKHAPVDSHMAALPLTGLLVMSAVHAARILDGVKKLSIYAKPTWAVTVAEILKDMGHLEYWIGLVRAVQGISYEEAVHANITKLSVRYASGRYSNEQAQARADKDPGQ